MFKYVYWLMDKQVYLICSTKNISGANEQLCNVSHLEWELPYEIKLQDAIILPFARK
jgi:hypothetical protein